MIETPEEFAQKIKDYCFDAWTMNREQKQYMGEFDLDEATRLITDFTALLRAECAERAIAWYTKDAGPELLPMYQSGVPGLRAAIMGEP